MGRILVFSAVLCLVGGLGAAYAEPLTVNTDIFQVSPAAGTDFSGALFAKASKKNVDSDSSDSASSASASIGKNFWIKAYGGYDMALQGDYVNGMKALTSYAANTGYPSPSTKGDGTGIAAGGEFGFQIDPMDALSVGCENIWGSTISSSGVSATQNYNMSITPSALNLTLNYYRTLVNGNGAKTQVFIGGGLYFGSSNFSFGNSTTTAFSGDFTGSTVGGVLGIDEELALNDTFSFMVTAKGRLAAIGKESSNAVSGSGGVAPGTYDITRTTDLSPGNAILFINPETTPLDANTHLAVMDESGFDANVAFVAHF